MGMIMLVDTGSNDNIMFGYAYKGLSEEMGFPVCGNIGTHFMAEHDWMFDFANQEVIIPDTDVSLEKLNGLVTHRS